MKLQILAGVTIWRYTWYTRIYLFTRLLFYVYFAIHSLSLSGLLRRLQA